MNPLNLILLYVAYCWSQIYGVPLTLLLSWGSLLQSSYTHCKLILVFICFWINTIQVFKKSSTNMKSVLILIKTSPWSDAKSLKINSLRSSLLYYSWKKVNCLGTGPGKRSFLGTSPVKRYFLGNISGKRSFFGDWSWRKLIFGDWS